MSMRDPELEDRAARRAAQLNAVGVQTDPGLGGGVVIYADDEQAALFLAAAEHQDREPAGTGRPQTFAEWRRDNSGTLADYENYLAGQAIQPVTREVIRAGAEDERLRLTEQELHEHAANLQAEISRHERALRHIADTYRLRLTATTPEPEPSLRQAILAGLPADAGSGLTTRQITRRVAQAIPGLADVRPAVVSRELETLRTGGYAQGTAYPPSPVCWSLTEAGRRLAAAWSAP
jgi:hypothetical protein